MGDESCKIKQALKSILSSVHKLPRDPSTRPWLLHRVCCLGVVKNRCISSIPGHVDKDRVSGQHHEPHGQLIVSIDKKGDKKAHGTSLVS